MSGNDKLYYSYRHTYLILAKIITITANPQNIPGLSCTSTQRAPLAKAVDLNLDHIILVVAISLKMNRNNIIVNHVREHTHHEKLAELILGGGALGVSRRVPCVAGAAAWSVSKTSLPSTFSSSTSPTQALPGEAGVAPASMASISVPNPVPSATEDAENIRKAVQGISSCNH